MCRNGLPPLINNRHHFRRSDNKVSDWIMFLVTRDQVSIIFPFFHSYFIEYKVIQFPAT